MSIFDHHDEREEVRLLRELVELTRAIKRELAPKFPIKFVFTQGANMPIVGTIKGIVPGGSDTIFMTPVDVNGNADKFPVGSPIPTITCPDATITVVVAADGSSALCTVPATAVVGSTFALNGAGSYTDPTTGNVVNVTGSVSIPVIAPPALNPVGFVFSQGSPAA